MDMKDDTNPPVSGPKTGIAVPSKSSIKQSFDAKAGARTLIVRDIERRMEKALEPIVPHPTIKARTKSFASYYKKHVGQLNTGSGIPCITDLMGIRIVCPFINDLAQAEKLIHDNFDVTEVDRKGSRYSHKEFGYESIHLLIKIPEDIARVRGNAGCDVVEIQIRTILQDAWAEVEHEIFYKGEFSPLDSQKRKLSAVNASLFLADTTFQEIRSYQENLIKQLVERRDNFYQKIDEASDAFILLQKPGSAKNQPESASHDTGNQPKAISLDLEKSSIDDLLLEALTIHNNKQFEDAIAVYSSILEAKNPGNAICSLIYKHRGLAYFAQSRYDEAISDFTKAFDLGEKSHMPVYYRGLVHSVLQQYPQAIDDFTLSLQINPYQSYCLFRRGQAYYHVGDYPKALADCNASLSMEPGRDVICTFRDLIHSKLKA